jgi:hypothetical protein
MMHRIAVLLFMRDEAVASAKEGAVKMFGGLMLIVGVSLTMGLSGHGPIDAVAEQSVLEQASQSEDTLSPVYIPPKRLTPRARVGGTLSAPRTGQIVARIEF